MTIRAVIFDRDNTLLRFDPGAIAALEARIAAIAPTLPPGAATRHWIDWPGPWPHVEEDEPMFWRAFWGDLSDRFGLPEATRLKLLAIGGFYHTCFVAFPDAASCLDTLQAAGLRLAVLTNYELPSIRQTLHHAGLDPDAFSALISSTTIGIRKPDPRAYLAVAAALDLPASECAFVDDLPANVAAACAVGMRGWLLDRDRTAEAGGLDRIDDLGALVARLAVLGHSTKR
jgi:FMN phosphatase YigB (HAD superfamily)